MGDLLGRPTEETIVPPRYRYEEIADDLQKRIEAGEFPPGARLPSRRELTAHYEVTAPVIDRAMQILRVKGITETLAGVGVYVRDASEGS
ncbi:FadR family transcriptional regulator [Actinoplanes sp. TBRC 11911]|nr:FadR family transcriptional regulator [Actinoplanes sp. TBRC 11911]